MEIIDAHQHIGIWKLQNENGQLVYRKDDQYRSDWNYWSDTPFIPLKTDRKRVLLLGESVARGFLYDPGFNLSQVLKQLISQEMEGAMIDFVDLAKVSLQFDELERLMTASSVLEPDVVIIFAGNNWDVFSMPDYEQKIGDWGQSLAAGNHQQVKAGIEEVLKQGIRQFLMKLKERFAGRDAIVVIPEFNLMDWRSAKEEQYVPDMGVNAIEEWIVKKEEALHAFRIGDYETLQVLSSHLISLDGTNPLGYELYAESRLAVHDHIAARHYLEQARDMALFGRTDSRPRCFSVTRQTLLACSAEMGFHCIDLPAVFSDLREGKLPDRALFIDYCHLSANGIRIAAMLIARDVIQVFTGRLLNIEELEERCAWPDTSIAGMAHFYAAVTNAHFGQSEDVISYHCEEALRQDKELYTVFRDYARLSSRKTQAVICSEFVRLFTDGKLAQYQNGMSMMLPEYKKLLDVVLVDTLTRLCARHDNSFPGEISALRRDEHGISNGTVNLLESFYSKQNFYHQVNGDPNYYRAASERSCFQFVANGEGAVIDITLRLEPLKSRRQEVELLLNGQFVTRFFAGPEWCHYTFDVPAILIKEGINDIQVIWPVSSHSEDLIYTADNFKSFWNAYYCNFGEIYSFKISEVKD